MKVLFFAHCRDAAGCDHALLKIDRPVTEAEFWAALVNEFPKLVGFQKTARLARRETYLQPGDSIEPGDEIALIPPVSGG
jgi:molybdopterin converting factor subunit 1